MEHFVGRSFPRGGKIFGQQGIIPFAVPHLLFWRGGKRLVCFCMVEFVLVSAVELHPRSARVVWCLFKKKTHTHVSGARAEMKKEKKTKTIMVIEDVDE